MTQARTVGRRRRHDHDHDIEDARDVDALEELATAILERPRWCRLMTPSGTAWREVAQTDDLNKAITLANLANARVVVFEIRTGKQVYDNRK